MGIWRRAPPGGCAASPRKPPTHTTETAAQRRGRLDVSAVGARQGARTRAFLGGGAGEAGARGAEGPPNKPKTPRRLSSLDALPVSVTGPQNLKPHAALPVMSTRA